MLDQIVHCVFRGSRLKIFLVVNRHHGDLIVVIELEAGHADDATPVFPILPNLAVSGIFLQPLLCHNRQPEHSVGCPAPKGTKLMYLLALFFVFGFFGFFHVRLSYFCNLTQFAGVLIPIHFFVPAIELFRITKLSK